MQEEDNGGVKSRSVLQDWVMKLSFMQQAVLMASVRGPDGIHKDHVAKLLLRWFRRCVFISAFVKKVLTDPIEDDRGSFTGPSLSAVAPASHPHVGDWPERMDVVVKEYLRACDEIPHHFQLHLLHAAEILGYKHPDKKIRDWWRRTYEQLVNDMHLYPESDELMSKRLGDSETNWRAREEVTAKGPA